MQPQYRIRKNGQFRYVYRKGRHTSGNLLRLHFVQGRRLQVGFAVSKQVGGAAEATAFGHAHEHLQGLEEIAAHLFD